MLDANAQAIVYASAQLVEYPLPRGMQVMRRFGGRPYFDLDSLQWSLYDSLGISPADANLTIGGFQPEIPVPDRGALRGRAGLARVRRRFQAGQQAPAVSAGTPPGRLTR